MKIRIKKILRIPLIIGLILISNTQADYTIRLNFGNDIKIKDTIPEIWSPTEPVITAWENFNTVYNCTMWSKNPSEFPIGIEFSKIRICDQVQKRNITNYEISNKGNIRQSGEVIEESQIISLEESEIDYGTRHNRTIYPFEFNL